MPLWRKDQIRNTPEVALAEFTAGLALEVAALRERIEDLERIVEPYNEE